MANTKNDWIELSQNLETFYRNFLLELNDYSNGKNKKIRSEADKKLSEIIDDVIYLIKKNQDAFQLLVGKNSPEENISEFFREFKTYSWFKRDMNTYLQKIQETIKNFKDGE